MKTNVIHNEECLQGMSERIPNDSIDMILADLPYGTTACEWDSIIPLEPLWEQYKRVAKENVAIILTASGKFTPRLKMSNLEWFRYEWIWVKSRPGNYFLGDKQPLKVHESILVFLRKQPTYNPQYRKLPENTVKRNNRSQESKRHGEVYGDNSNLERPDYSGKKDGYPVSVIKFKKDVNNQFKKQAYHPTQKPVDLFKYLIKTYTNKGDIILDNVIGSGTTAVAAKALDRKYIGFEQDEEYYEIAQERVSEVQKELI